MNVKKYAWKIQRVKFLNSFNLKKMNQLVLLNKMPVSTGKTLTWVSMWSWLPLMILLITKTHFSVRKTIPSSTKLSKAIWTRAKAGAPTTSSASHLTTARTVCFATWETPILTQPRNSTNQQTNLTCISVSWQRNWHCFPSNPFTFWARTNKAT